MNLNFVNANTFLGDIISSAKGTDAGIGGDGIGTGTSFADRLMAVLSPETSGDGKVTVEDLEDIMDEKSGENMVLPISGLPFISSILSALQIPEQVSTRLISDAKQEGVGIDLDQLIKGLQSLQKESFFSGVDFDADSQSGGVEQMLKSLGLETDEGDTRPLTLDGFVAGLEKLRTSLELTATAETDGQQETEPGAKVLASLLTSLQIPEQNANSLTLDDFVAALETLGMSPGATGLTPVTETGGGMDPDLSNWETQENKIYARNPNALLVRNLAVALEKMDQSTLSDSLELAPAGLTGKSDVESILGSLINSMGQNKGQSMEMGGLFKQAESSPGEVSTSGPMEFLGDRGDPKAQTPVLPEIQAVVDPEFSKSMETLAAVIKDMKTSIDDTGMMEQGVSDRNMAKDPGKIVAAIDLSGGAGGEFRQMGMDSRAQAVAEGGSPRTILPSHVTSQVGKSLARAVSQGDTELKLQLKPPELGRIIMTIDNLGSSLKVSVVTENQAAKDILASQANELKAALANSGISVDSFDVEMGSDFNQSMADARHHAKGSGSKRGRTRVAGTGAVEGGGDSMKDIRGFAGDARLLHLVA